ncbi:MAG: pseudouridine synthase, partial [Planctomycetaceae bacterium]
LAVVERPPNPDAGELIDWIERIDGPAKARIVAKDTPGARESRLAYRTLAVRQGRALLEVELQTGRTHQIRAQLAARGWPIVGDKNYGARLALDRGAIALHAVSLVLTHPIHDEELRITAPVPQSWQRFGFDIDAACGDAPITRRPSP